MKENLNKNYRIVIISPEDYIHSSCFREMALLLISSLKSNNIDCDFAINEFSKEKINIILGYHLLDKKQIQTEIIEKKTQYIPFQLEQLTSEEFIISENIRFVLENSMSVWDYSIKNIEYLKKKNINVNYIPIGYHKDLEIIKTIPDEEKDIDILFYGSIGKRRKKILDTLSQKYKVKILFGVYGAKRDEYISRSKIVLNIHHYSAQLLEMVRLSYLINNRVFLISENATENPYGNLGIEFLNYHEIIKGCEFYLKKNGLREKQRKKSYVAFKKTFPMEKIIAEYIKNNEKKQ